MSELYKVGIFDGVWVEVEEVLFGGGFEERCDGGEYVKEQ
jgi:hypothetical protein